MILHFRLPRSLSPRRAAQVALICSLLIAALSAPSRASAAAPGLPEVQRVATPAWIEIAEVDYRAAPSAQSDQRATRTLLRDTRIRIGPEKVERYHRRVEQAVSATGVEALAEVLIEWLPAHEELKLHTISVVRGGSVIDQSKASARVIEQESDLERRIYSGSVSALIVLSDVRVGDIVDVAYSIVGENPELAGRYTGRVAFRSDDPVERLHVEVRSHRSRAERLAWKGRGDVPAPTERYSDGDRVLSWDLRDVSPISFEDRVPIAHRLSGILNLSEFAAWKDVAAWGAPHYTPVRSKALAQKAEAIKATGGDTKSLVLKALRFVQDEIRYLSVSLDHHAMRPHEPDQVLAQRFGDCKDKSYLLVELLRELGVEARPALVNTDFREHIAGELPSPSAFDHVIVKVLLDGRAYWVDPTWTYQGGSLETQEPPPFGRALVIAPESAELESVPAPQGSEPTRDVDSEYLVHADGSAALRVTTTYRGTAADSMRADLAATPSTEIGEHYANYYEKTFSTVTVTKPLEAKDDRDRNILTTTERYLIGDFWKQGERWLYPDDIWNYLARPRVMRRESPLSLKHPVWIREAHHVSLPYPPEIPTSDETFEDNAVVVRQSLSSQGQRAFALYEYKTKAAVVPVASLAAHFKVLEQAQDALGLWMGLHRSGRTGKRVTRANAPINMKAIGWAVVLCSGLASVIAIVPAVRALRRRARKLNFKKRRDGSDGDSPARPVAAASLEEARALLAKSRCACGSPAGAGKGELTEVRYDSRKLQVGRVECQACGQPCRMYFALPQPAERGSRDTP